MDLREQTREYMKARHLSRQEMAELVDVRCHALAKYLDNLPGCGKESVEAALRAYFLKLERVEARAKRPEFIPTLTANLILEKLQEADERRGLGLLYGPPGIGKTFAVEEFMDQVERQPNPEKPEVLLVTAHSASTPKSLMAALCLQAGVPHQGTASALAESLVRKLETGHYLVIVDEANHLDIEAMELLRYVYDLGRLGVVLIGTLRLYEVFTDGSRPAGELEQLWSRVGICELLPGLMEHEARQMVQKQLGRIPEITFRQILKQSGNSIRRLTKLLERLNELRHINDDCGVEDLIVVAGNGMGI
ncbi:MAG: AAA family ATPase [Acidobacteriia bacterium]|nr:AAA family ATPase [Terriglobia bacterium]